MRRPLAALALLLALVPSAANAQRSGARSSSSSREHAARSMVGIPVAMRLLQSDDPLTRARGVERLGALGTPEAIDALVEALEGSGAALRDARIRLTAVRVLAGETKRDAVRQLLLREVTDTTGGDGRGPFSPLSAALRGTAALALARGGDPKAVAALAGTLLRPGPAADAASLALRTYPPVSLEVFVDTKRPASQGEHEASKPAGKDEPAAEGRRRLSPQQAAFLGEIGDMRAIDRLRALLAEGEAAGKLAAASALARLGDAAALPIAKEWAKKPDPKLRVAAAEALIALDAPEAAEAVTALIEGADTREHGLRLALRAPTPELAAPLAKLLPALAPEARPRAIAAIGRARGAAELAPLLEKLDTETDAAFALATMPGVEARAALEKTLGGEKGQKGEERRLFTRAGVVRALMLGDAPGGLRAALKAMWKGPDLADRTAAAFGLVALGWLSLGDAIDASCNDDARCEPAIVGAAARGALALPDGAGSLEPLFPLLRRAARLAGERDAGPLAEALAAAAGPALLAHPDGGELPTPVLAVWAESGGPISPLAARALPSRDDEALRGRIKRLLEGTDPVIRAHTALGLANDPEPSATALLVNAYRFEDDASVRRAIVRALSRRSEVQRVATLGLARDLDPDDDVRALARAALDGRDLEPRVRPANGPEPRRSVAWITVRSTELGPASGAGGAKEVPVRAARLVRVDGIAVPVLADHDGVLVVPGLPPGPATVLLARP